MPKEGGKAEQKGLSIDIQLCWAFLSLKFGLTINKTVQTKYKAAGRN